MELYIKALSIRERMKDKQNIASILNSIGVLFWYQGDFSNALDFPVVLKTGYNFKIMEVSLSYKYGFESIYKGVITKEAVPRDLRLSVFVPLFK